MTEARQKLKMLPKFANSALDLRTKVSDERGIPIGDINFVGIHNRRTDYVQYMDSMYGERSPYTKSYFRDAMDYFRGEYEDTVFFYVSDDMDWGRKNLKKKKKREKDLYFVGREKCITL
jgi:hypothetical protein